jgi:hypothetical protein
MNDEYDDENLTNTILLLTSKNSFEFPDLSEFNEDLTKIKIKKLLKQNSSECIIHPFLFESLMKTHSKLLFNNFPSYYENILENVDSKNPVLSSFKINTNNNENSKKPRKRGKYNDDYILIDIIQGLEKNIQNESIAKEKSDDSDDFFESQKYNNNESSIFLEKEEEFLTEIESSDEDVFNFTGEFFNENVDEYDDEKEKTITNKKNNKRGRKTKEKQNKLHSPDTKIETIPHNDSNQIYINNKYKLRTLRKKTNIDNSKEYCESSEGDIIDYNLIHDRELEEEYCSDISSGDDNKFKLTQNIKKNPKVKKERIIKGKKYKLTFEDDILENIISKREQVYLFFYVFISLLTFQRKN